MRPVYQVNGAWAGQIETTFATLASTGYLGIELAPGPLFYPYTRWSDRNAAQLRHQALAFGLSIANIDLKHVISSGMLAHEATVMTNNAEVRQSRVNLVCSALQFAANTGAPLVSFPTGPSHPEMPRDEAMALLIEGLEICLDEAKASGVRLAIEPTPGHLISSYSDYLQLRYYLSDDMFGLCYDVANAYAVFEDCLTVIYQASDLLHIQMADAKNNEDVHLTPGAGALQLNVISDWLQASGYPGFISVELDEMNDNDVAARIALATISPYYGGLIHPPHPTLM